ncbi:hypothetical protein AYI70_g11627 [Smittium culicis]|uniref:Uncharacterized protein n=1 Tax=Smittium culicis TaxID=133412 RepID=A0A1R1X142_9FUNG|nr:hypothetical protein AYI70_g11627 [Smittium culicis]
MAIIRQSLRGSVQALESQVYCFRPGILGLICPLCTALYPGEATDRRSPHKTQTTISSHNKYDPSMRTAERHQRLHLCSGAALHQRSHEQPSLRKAQPIEPVCKCRIVADLRAHLNPAFLSASAVSPIRIEWMYTFGISF